jgi:LysM repeat protein
MKKISIVMLIPVLLVIFSCATTEPAPPPPPPAPAAQPAPPPPPPPEPEPVPTVEEVYETYSDDLVLEGAKSYTVLPGDTLSKITRAYYGRENGYFFPIIMLASRETVTDPDLIEPGMVLTIPDLPKNLDSSGARTKMKEFLNEIANAYGSKDQTTVRDQLRALASSL